MTIKCPNCTASMKVSQGTPSRPLEYLCLSCGFKKPAFPDVKGEPMERETAPLLPHSEELSQTSKKRKVSTASRMRRMDEAKRLTDLRQISKDLTGRIGDLGIQFERRMEELQKLAVELEQIVSSYRN